MLPLVDEGAIQNNSAYQHKNCKCKWENVGGEINNDSKIGEAWKTLYLRNNGDIEVM